MTNQELGIMELKLNIGDIVSIQNIFFKRKDKRKELNIIGEHDRFYLGKTKAGYTECVPKNPSLDIVLVKRQNKSLNLVLRN